MLDSLSKGMQPKIKAKLFAGEFRLAERTAMPLKTFNAFVGKVFSVSSSDEDNGEK